MADTQNVTNVEMTNPEIHPISYLANLRKHLADMKQKKADMIATLEGEPEYRLTLSEIKSTEAMIEGLTGSLKDHYASLAETDETGKVLNPNPHPAVTLKRFDATKLIYDGKKAFQYCLNNFSSVLSLDVKEFEKFAKMGKLPEDVVVVKPEFEIRVQFSTDLSKYENETKNIK